MTLKFRYFALLHVFLIQQVRDCGMERGLSFCDSVVITIYFAATIPLASLLSGDHVSSH